MANRPRRALIVGAGIGGLSAAIVLRRAGLEPIVFERGAELRHIQVGVGHHIYPNGIRVLQQFDPSIVDEMRAVGAMVEYFEFFHWRGQLLARWPIGDWGRNLGAPTIGLRRRHLHSILFSRLENGVVQFGRRCTGFRQDPARVFARFADFEHERLPYGHFRNWLGRGQRFLTLDVSPSLRAWCAVANSPEGATADGRNKDLVLERFRGWLEPIEALVEATPQADVNRMDIYDRDPVGRWSEGRVTLLGDAAHPMTFNGGQGANQAIEDGFVLSRCLAAEDNVHAALGRYEAERIPRTAMMTRVARRLGALLHWKNPAACVFRDQILIKGVLSGFGGRKLREFWASGP